MLNRFTKSVPVFFLIALIVLSWTLSSTAHAVSVNYALNGDLINQGLGADGSIDGMFTRAGGPPSLEFLLFGPQNLMLSTTNDNTGGAPTFHTYEDVDRFDCLGHFCDYVSVAGDFLFTLRIEEFTNQDFTSTFYRLSERILLGTLSPGDPGPSGILIYTAIGDVIAAEKAVVPEPGTALLLSTGLLGVVGYQHWQRRRRQALEEEAHRYH